jgi:hypothetical protein
VWCEPPPLATSQSEARLLPSHLPTLHHHFHFHFHFRLDFLRGRRSRQPVGPPSASSPPRPLASYSSLLGLSHDVPPLPLVAVALCANHRPTKPTAVRRLKPGLCSKGLQGAEGWALGRAGQTGQGRDGKLSHAPSWIHDPRGAQGSEQKQRRPGCAIPCQATPTDLEKQRAREGWQAWVSTEEMCSETEISLIRRPVNIPPRLALFVH